MFVGGVPLKDAQILYVTNYHSEVVIDDYKRGDLAMSFRMYVPAAMSVDEVTVL